MAQLSKTRTASARRITVTAKSPARAKKPGGGTAAGGGINFQAAVMAIAAVHLLRGTSLGWLPIADVPVAVWAESEGPGDDIRLELTSDLVAEIQAKKGLNRGAKLWEALEALVKAIRDGDLGYGVLAVAPDSSSTIREDLATDLERLAQGRHDHLTDIGSQLHSRLRAIGGDWKEACTRIVIRVVHALEGDGADIRAAKEVLRSVCADKAQADAAWNALYRDAVARIEHRGRWTVPYLLRLLRKEGIPIRASDFPAAIAQKLADWVGATNKEFTLTSVRKPLPLDALLRMRTVATLIDQPDAEDAAAALARYHDATRALDRDTRIFDAEWTGRFRCHAVIVAGPGLGKSTLIKLLANRYAADGFPVLNVRFKPIAAAMERGVSFDQALRSQALDGSGITPEQFDQARFGDLVILADGLDDCGPAHDAVARALRAFAHGHPSVRVVVTTRPIGYTTATFADWQHYRLLAPGKDDGAANLAKLLGALKEDSKGDLEAADSVFKHAQRELAQSRAADTISTSPLLLGMAAAVIVSKDKLPDTRPRLYAGLISLFETSQGAATPRPVTAPIATRILNSLGWLLMRDPLISVDLLTERLAELLAAPLGCTTLAATEVVEPALTYWEQLGIIERLHHGGVAYWTFVHKSFTEFTAARHLIALPEAQRTSELNRLVDEADWHEVVAFVSGLGLGDEIARLFVNRGATGQERLIERSLALAADRDANISDALVRQLAEFAFAMVDAGSVDRFSIGVALADLAKVHPSTIAPIAAARCDDRRDAVQLVAWACLVAAAPKEQDAAKLARVLAMLLPMISQSMRKSLLGGIQLRGGKDHDLIERVALAALQAQPDADLKAFAETQFAHDTLATLGFLRKVEALLRARGIGEQIKFPWRGSALQSGLALMDPPDEWRLAATKALRALAEAALTSRDLPHDIAEPSRLPQFGALYALSGFGDAPGYDAYTWARPFDEGAVRAVVQAVVRASAIDSQALSIEAAVVVRRVEANDRLGLFDLDLPNVDVPPPDWSKAAALVPDWSTLVAAIDHGSDCMAYLAGNILAASSAPPEKVRALLDGVRGTALWAATEVVHAQQPVEIANALILDRLAGSLPRGAEHLFKGLEKGGVNCSPALSEAIRRGLASPHGRVAEGAANLAKNMAERGQPLPPSILLEAYDNWRKNDPPQESGIVPPSPRETLLNLLIAENALNDERLISALSDVRFDVRDAAEKHVVDAIATSAPLRDLVIASILSREVPAGIAASILRREPPLSAEHLAGLKALLRDPVAKWRRVAVELLRPSYFTPEQIADYAAELANDDEAEIRDAAAARYAAIGNGSNEFNAEQ
jgi:hypothetical protein